MIRYFFVSDVHFRGDDSASERRFISFLRRISGPFSVLYLVGDILDFWVGHDGGHECYAPLITELKALRDSGTQIHYFTGNHDPAVHEAFVQMGARIHLGGLSQSIDGHKVWIEHGDLAPGDGWMNRLACQVARAPAVQKLARVIPLKLAWKLAQAYTARMHIYDRPLSERILRTWFDGLVNKNYDVVIMGHYHRAVFHGRHYGGAMKRLIVLGDWADQCTFASYDGDFKLYRCTDGDASPTPVPPGDHAPQKSAN